MHFHLLFAIGLFFIAMLLDAVYAIYTFAMIKYKSLLSGFMSGLVYIFGAVGVVSYVNNKWYLVPLSMGAFIGTIIVIEYEKRHKQD